MNKRSRRRVWREEITGGIRAGEVLLAVGFDDYLQKTSVEIKYPEPETKTKPDSEPKPETRHRTQTQNQNPKPGTEPKP